MMMKIRGSIIGFCFIVVIATILLLWLKKPQSPQSSAAVASETNTAPLVAPVPSQSAGAVTPSPAPKTTPIIRTNIPGPAVGSKVEREIGLLSTYNDVPIDFYGRLEDQFGNLVANAQVNFTVRIINGRETDVKRGQVSSDANGLFTILGYKGQDLSIVPQKEGYVLATTGTFFQYSRLTDHPYVSDPNNPEIIKIWKLQGGEHLIHFQKEVRIAIDGMPTTFNLQTGEQGGSGGDIIVSVQSTPNPNIRAQYDWQVNIQAVAGGLIVSSDDFEQMFQAPESGYASPFDFTYLKNGKPWSTTFTGSFYLMSRSKNSYGKFGVEILSDVVKNGSIPLIINSFVNPAGSRNLEIDPKSVTEAQP